MNTAHFRFDRARLRETKTLVAVKATLEREVGKSLLLRTAQVDGHGQPVRALVPSMLVVIDADGRIRMPEALARERGLLIETGMPPKGNLSKVETVAAPPPRVKPVAERMPPAWPPHQAINARRNKAPLPIGEIVRVMREMKAAGKRSVEVSEIVDALKTASQWDVRNRLIVLQDQGIVRKVPLPGRRVAFMVLERAP